MTRSRKRREGGFTLAFTIFLSLVLSLMAIAVVAKVFMGIKQAGFDKGRQAASDAALIGLNMAIDEISPGIERMRNAVFSGATSSTTANPYPEVLKSQAMLTFTAGAYQAGLLPVRELTLLGNIRNWEAFADWTKSYGDAAWQKGWTFVPDGNTVEYFDSTTKYPVQVAGVNTTGSYWYSQLLPAPPTVGGNPGTSAAPAAWVNRATEYPQGLFKQPILKKVYTVQQEPRVRVAVYVRMSLQDYFGNDSTNLYVNRGLDGFSNKAPSSGSFDASNYRDTNAITFSIFAVSENTTVSRGTRIHQALNVTVGGAEYVTGLTGDTSGLESSARLRSLNGSWIGDNTLPYYDYFGGPFFAPTLETPSGNGKLVGFTPITGQVFPASGDLRFNFATAPATDQVAFLYEMVELPGSRKVTFLIEQVPPGVNGATAYWRRRLLQDWPPRDASQSALFGSNLNYPISFARASYSISPWQSNDAAFPSMLHWLNLKATESIPLQSDGVHEASMDFIVQSANFEEHFYRSTFSPSLTTFARYPLSAVLTATGSFVIGTVGAPSGSGRAGDVVYWPDNPLVASPGTDTSQRLPAYLPWQGPTIGTNGATVSYYCMTWPFRSNSTLWTSQGGPMSLAYQASVWKVR